jgi:hypothetical protein
VSHVIVIVSHSTLETQSTLKAVTAQSLGTNATPDSSLFHATHIVDSSTPITSITVFMSTVILDIGCISGASNQLPESQLTDNVIVAVGVSD